MSDSKIKTLLIEDSGFMRILLSDLLCKSQNIEQWASARKGLEGAKESKNTRPTLLQIPLTETPNFIISAQ